MNSPIFESPLSPVVMTNAATIRSKLFKSHVCAIENGSLPRKTALNIIADTCSNFIDADEVFQNYSADGIMNSKTEAKTLANEYCILWPYSYLKDEVLITNKMTIC